MRSKAIILTTLVVAHAQLASAQGSASDYERALTLRDRYSGQVLHMAEAPRWIEQTNRFYYRRTVKGGHEWFVVDAASGTKQPAFDHEKLAAGIATATTRKATAVQLPFTTFAFVDNGRGIEFTLTGPNGPQGADADPWRCSLETYACRQQSAGRGGRGGRGGGGLAGPVRPEFDVNGGQPRRSPDGKHEALVRNYNLAIREHGKREFTVLTTDGSEGNYYDPDTIAWSPDSQKIAAYRVRPGQRRYVHFVESSPEDQLQPKHSTMQYAKPGDVLDVEMPVVVHVGDRKRLDVDNALFPNAYDNSRLVWRKNSAAVTFEYNQRGHQVFRVIEINATDGSARAVISEEPKTFFAYSGKRFRQDIEERDEIIWMSERDGWNHLYLYDSKSGRVKNQITRGAWPVRSVVRVDEEARQIYFAASGMHAGRDPYFLNYYRINFDGSALQALTTAEANHNASFSPNGRFFVDTYSRVDAAPITEIRMADGTLVSTIERADLSGLQAAGWKAPESFVAKGRDGKTDIWGLIFRPTNFDPSKKYPVIENIYAGPHSSHVPKSFAAYNQMQAQAEIGFIVVQIDGMGTSNRSKAFHDVAWQNIKDAGFPDRILWHKAAAAKYAYYDITRVGIYGTSAGGQNSLGALLFFPDFYKAAVSAAGCHDNRMDKIWWNEQWMGWPLGEHYSASSNVENASRLQGKVLLVVGEIDNNVDPASTYQVVNQLIKHNKDFDLLVIPGAGHTAGGVYGERKRFDFFTKHLLGVAAPEWKAVDEALKKSSGS